LIEDRAMVLRVRDERPDLEAASDAELVARASAMTPLVRELFDPASSEFAHWFVAFGRDHRSWGPGEWAPANPR